MIAHEFQTDVTPEGTLRLPEELVRQLPAGHTVRVLVLVADTEERDWQQLTRDQFFRDDADGDAIYDQLSTR